MKPIIIDPGHKYQLPSIDGDNPQVLTFVKREGPGFPGNEGEYPGTTIQAVLRTLIDRVGYLDRQIPCEENTEIIIQLMRCNWLLEKRASSRHNMPFNLTPYECFKKEMCPICGHTNCHHQ